MCGCGIVVCVVIEVVGESIAPDGCVQRAVAYVGRQQAIVEVRNGAVVGEVAVGDTRRDGFAAVAVAVAAKVVFRAIAIPVHAFYKALQGVKIIQSLHLVGAYFGARQRAVSVIPDST